MIKLYHPPQKHGVIMTTEQKLPHAIPQKKWINVKMDALQSQLLKNTNKHQIRSMFCEINSVLFSFGPMSIFIRIIQKVSVCAQTPLKI